MAGTKAPKDNPLLDASDTDHLERFAKSARERAAEVGEQVNPTNIFALTYIALAENCEKLLALFVERGHTGVPENGV